MAVLGRRSDLGSAQSLHSIYIERWKFKMVEDPTERVLLTGEGI